VCEPEIQILGVFAGLEEENVVAAVQVGEGVEGRIVVVVGFCVEFGVFVRVREEQRQIVEEMALAG
jgi:hypothetical protein